MSLHVEKPRRLSSPGLIWPWLLSLLLWGCHAGTDGGEARPPDTAPGDAKGDAIRGIVFPRDEAPHNEQMEWWYYTGRVKTAKGGIYGFEVTFFQPKIADNLVHLVHYAITDLVKKTYSCEMQVTGEAPPAQPDEGFWLKVGKTEIKGHAGKDTIKAVTDSYTIQLSLTTLKPVTLQYGTGFMTIGSAKPFYYYSYTRMAATGSITTGGVTETVTGEAWMDHQWGTIGTGYGWDWFSLRLDDRTELMLFKVRRGGEKGFCGGTFIDSMGSPRVLEDKDFTVASTGSWTSPRTQITYSHGWTITVSDLDLLATVTPTLADQEFSKSVLGSPTYWEGLCDVSGTRSAKSITGHAYVEITGHVPDL